jgi:hypothetical protein
VWSIMRLYFYVMSLNHRQLEINFTVIDIKKEYVQAGNECSTLYGFKIKFICQDFLLFKIEENFFEIIICFLKGSITDPFRIKFCYVAAQMNLGLGTSSLLNVKKVNKILNTNKFKDLTLSLSQPKEFFSPLFMIGQVCLSCTATYAVLCFCLLCNLLFLLRCF